MAGAGAALAARIDVTRPVGAQMQRILIALLDDCVHLLNARSGAAPDAIHDARKNLKAFRSYLRLMRAVVGEADYTAMNTSARDAARRLSEARDAQALHDAIDQVDRFLGKRKQRPDVAPLHHAADGLARQSAGEDAIKIAVRDVCERLAPCRATIGGWTLPDVAAPYISGLAKTYSRARREMRHGLDTRLPADLHEARKRVIHWRYQLELFTNLWPRVLKAEVRELQDLREDLGQHNDLVMLEHRLRDAEGGFKDLGDKERFLDSITVLRADRARAAKYRSSLLFVDGRGARAEHLQAWWRAALGK
jgi:CHAD domain-containing protein